MRRILGIVLAVLLIGGVVAVILAGGGPQDPEHTATKTVHGVIGSEKAEFFADPDVVKALAAKGYTVKTETSGSWAMDQLPLKNYDFAFPSSSEPAKEVKAKSGTQGSQTVPFFSPLVVVARTGTAQVLADNGLAKLTGKNTGTLLMGEFVKAAREDRTWQQLKGSAAHPELLGKVLIRSTDPASSNSGALYLAALSNVANGHTVVSDDQGVEATAPLLNKLTAPQGQQPPSTDAPFREFISGAGQPLVLVYESQVAALLLRGQPAGDTVVLYPDTTVNSDHTFVPLNDTAKELGELLATDPALRELAVRHGFRPQNGVREFTSATAPHTNYLNQNLAGINQVGTPTVRILQKLAERAKG
ncbi:substrate-binding domain-containing protein [Streptomyces sp. NPDC089799]|uniref:substrate-binding domain-containing protein n=1 Tax=Streptomyces sp. NPDC089799 TaxID=3155066 RepID=UPI0034429EA4